VAIFAFAPLLSSFVPAAAGTQRFWHLASGGSRLPGFIGRVNPLPLWMRGWERQRHNYYNEKNWWSNIWRKNFDFFAENFW